MNHKVLKTLEYNKIIDMLTAFATSEPGRERCRNLQPMSELSGIESAQEQTADALSRIFKKSSPGFSGNRNLTHALKSLEIGSSLSCGEILKTASLLEAAKRARAYGKSEKEDAPADSLSALFESLEPLPSVLSEIRRCILDEDEYADDATPALLRIRRSLGGMNDRVHAQLTSLMNGSLRTFLQDSVITMRGDRYCLPIRAEYKNQVHGIIHDQSSSGSTVFIEPASVVELGNKLKELLLQEAEEIEKLLRSLSELIMPHTGSLLQNITVLTELDYIFARAGLAMSMSGTRPVFNTEGRIRIRKGRHPLIPAKKVVPIDISLGTDFDLLIVTGPNTGGKTVSLKTVGLFTLMGQSGLHIPALDRSELAVFDEVYADIGDEQSIEQSLSTFSSHMTGIVHILSRADEHSLCLFDELGAGTDPTEGAALAISILSHLHSRGIRTMATTHYSELKVYALSTPFVENACCEFDVQSLRPTYRLLIGVPGKSNAFAISSKLGLPDAIIREAQRQIDSEKVSFEDVITELENSRLSLEKERQEAEAAKQEITRLQEQLKAKNERIDAARDKILKRANEEARSILQDAKDVADETIRAFRKAGPGASMKDLEKARAKVRGRIDDKDKKLSFNDKPEEKGSLKPGSLRLGDTVKVISMGLKGTVSSLPDKKGNLFVQCGIIRSQVNISDLALIEEKSITAPSLQKGNSGHIGMSKSFSVSPEINLLGHTVDEALAELDKYLDDAYLAHLTSVRIVHGKGTGALRNAVHSHLKRMKNIKEYRLGAYGEGDAGVTIAVFR